MRYDCPLRSRIDALSSSLVDDDLLIVLPNDRSPTTVSFIRIPSSPTQGTAEEWAIELPVSSVDYLVWSEANLLVAILRETG